MLFVAYPSGTATRKDEIDWIIERAKRNISNGTQTCIISTYNGIVKNDFSDLLSNKLVLYVDIIHDAISGARSERTFQIDDRIVDISIFLSQLIEKSRKAQVPLDVIFHNFSALIHNLGDADVYRLVTGKTPQLDERTNLTLFICSKSHVEQIWEKFKNQAREVIEVKGGKT